MLENKNNMLLINKNKLSEWIKSKFEKLKDDFISSLNENLFRVENRTNGFLLEKIKQPSWIEEIDKHFSNNSNDNEREWIKKGFKQIKEENGKIIVSCSFPYCGRELKSRGTAWHWKKHTRLVKKIGFDIESDKITAICKKCNKKMNLFDAPKHFKFQHYQDLKKLKEEVGISKYELWEEKVEKWAEKEEEFLRKAFPSSNITKEGRRTNIKVRDKIFSLYWRDGRLHNPKIFLVNPNLSLRKKYNITRLVEKEENTYEYIMDTKKDDIFQEAHSLLLEFLAE